MREIRLPLGQETATSLRVGDEVTLTGWVLTGRDKACARLHAALQAGEPLPVELGGQLLYFVGPTPARPGDVIGAAGPTTTSRMNPFLPDLLCHGLRGFIGKGYVSRQVKDALVEHRGVYFGAVGGTGALLSKAIERVEVVAFDELLSEAIHRFQLHRFPAVVLFDTDGGDLYEEAIASE